MRCPANLIIANKHQSSRSNGRHVPFARIASRYSASFRAHPLDLLITAGPADSLRAAPWKVDDAPPNFIAAQMRAIIGIEIPISPIEGKWKMSQNRPGADRTGVVAGFARRALPAKRLRRSLKKGAER